MGAGKGRASVFGIDGGIAVAAIEMIRITGKIRLSCREGCWHCWLRGRSVAVIMPKAVSWRRSSLALRGGRLA